MKLQNQRKKNITKNANLYLNKANNIRINNFQLHQPF